MANTPNMTLPVDVPSITTGPQWAIDLEAMKLLLDQHTHVSGQGLPVPTAGLNINANLPIGGNLLTSVGGVGLNAQATTQSGTLFNTFQQIGGNLYWNNANAVPVQITAGNVPNVSASGVSGLVGTSAGITYSAALSTFIFTSAATLSAAIDAGAVTIRQTNVANSPGVTFQAPPTITPGGYATQLPSSGMTFGTTPGNQFMFNTGGSVYSPAQCISIGDGISTFGDFNGTNQVPFQLAHQAAVTTPSLASGCMVYVKRGTYVFTAPMVMTASGFVFFGESPNGSNIVGKVGTNQPIFQASGIYQGIQNLNIKTIPTATSAGVQGIQLAIGCYGCRVLNNNVSIIDSLSQAGGAPVELLGCGNYVTGNSLSSNNGNASGSPLGLIDTTWLAPQQGVVVSGNVVTGNVLNNLSPAANPGLSSINVNLGAVSTLAQQYTFTENIISNNNSFGPNAATNALFLNFQINPLGTAASFTNKGLIQRNAVIGNIAFIGYQAGIAMMSFAGGIFGTTFGAIGTGIFGNVIAHNILPSGSSFGYTNTVAPALYAQGSANTPAMGKLFVATSSAGAVTHQLGDIDFNGNM